MDEKKVVKTVEIEIKIEVLENIAAPGPMWDMWVV